MQDPYLQPGTSDNDPFFTDESECQHVWPSYAHDDLRELRASCVVCGERKYPEVADIEPVELSEDDLEEALMRR